MIACDIDGTLLNYNQQPGQTPAINHALIAQLAPQTDRIALITNQGGLVFGWQQRNRPDRKYPVPGDFALRLRHLHQALLEAGIMVNSVQVSLYHPKADADQLDAVRDVLWAEADDIDVPVAVYINETYRKPAPDMLAAVGVTAYYGDSDEDEAAARAAGCAFVRVARFEGGEQ